MKQFAKRLPLAVIMTTLMLFATLSAFSQNERPGEQEEMAREEKIERLKIAYLTTELNLTSAEAEKFWPVYNEMEGKLKETRKANRKLEKEIREAYGDMSNEDAKKKLTTILDNEAKEVAIRKEYADKISKVIGEKRTLKLLSLEHQFRRELLERLREQDPPPHPRQKHD